ncbi:fumarate hydratase C-terminal domain-containing protein [Candidatus Bathyarchaeota archaeon]|nr:fumarate hydratase C-terminal domain-containing protein [Candidatus Bathyarchaeota archaeon]
MTEYHFKTPVSEEKTRKLRVGDVLFISGTLLTARDSGHERALEYLREGKSLPVDFSGMALYHVGPVVKKEGDKWRIISAGPTTSARLEMYEADFIEKTGVKIIIGKGGMGSKTAEACKRFGAVYAIFTGGAGALAAKAVEEVIKVEWLDLGVPEALWVMKVREFGPLTVVIDSTGENFYEKMRKQVEGKLKKAYSIIGIE